MLKTGIISDAYFSFDNFEKGMPVMKAHGYDGIDYQGLGSMKNSPLYKMSDEEFKTYLTDLNACAKRNGLVIYQLHGTWPHVDDLTDEGRAQTVEYFKKCILGAKYLGCPKVIVHPLMPSLYWGEPFVEEQDFAVNKKMLTALAPVAREHGVTVCLENMPFPKCSAFSYVKNVKKLLAEIGDEYIKACLDTGHFNVEKGDIYEAVTLLGDDLAALHIHDDRNGQDRHLLPFQGDIDWDGFIRGLREISYKGVISLETNIRKNTPQPMRERMEIELANIARYIANEVEK
ncbi:MAG: sugar phosphate isomerase/epimerase [Clostridiales bacterium]|nr:sugar phosphate isomerase/epimerase [Clostridiales bacterium]